MELIIVALIIWAAVSSGKPKPKAAPETMVTAPLSEDLTTGTNQPVTPLARQGVAAYHAAQPDVVMASTRPPGPSTPTTVYVSSQGGTQSAGGQGSSFLNSTGGQLLATALARRLAPKNSFAATASDIGAGLTLAKPALALGQSVVGVVRASSTPTSTSSPVVQPSGFDYQQVEEASFPTPTPVTEISPSGEDLGEITPSQVDTTPMLDEVPTTL